MKIHLLSGLLILTALSTAAQEDSVKRVDQSTRKVQDLDEVVVTGQYEPQSLKNSVYNVRTISAAMIRLRGATDLKTILNTELGLRFSNDPATGISDPQLMGMSGASIKILLDGIPMMDRGTAKESLGQIDINTVERIEIVEGPMSVMYGTDAMAGVINIITKKSTNKNWSVNARIQEETAGKEYKAFQNNGTHNGNVGVNWQRNGWSAGIAASRNNFGGWQGDYPGRAMEWMPKQQWLANANVGYKTQSLDVWYRFNAADETLSLLGDARENGTTVIAADKKYLSNRFFHQAQAVLLFNDKLSFNASAAYTDYSRRTQSTNLDLRTGKETLSTDPGAQDKDIFGSAFFRATAQYKSSPSVSFQPGIEFNNNTGRGARIIGDPVINDYSFFLSSQIDLTSGIQIRPGFRLVKNSIYDAPPIIPSINTKFRINKNVDLRAAYARGFRAPILRELYFIFKDASHDIIGNPDLKAEYSNSFNGSLAWTGNNNSIKLNSIVSGFYNDFHNRIDIAVDENAGNINTYLNVSRYKTTGLEWHNTFYWKNLQATLGLAYIGRYNVYSAEADNLGEMQEFTWSPEWNTNISYLLPKVDMQLSFFYKYTGTLPQYVTYTDQNTGTQGVRLGEISSFHMADLTVNKVLNHLITINGGVRNLFNVTRITNTGGDSGSAHSTGDTVPMSYGRSFFLGLALNWNR